MRKPKPIGDALHERLEADVGYPIDAIQHVSDALYLALHDRALARGGQTNAAGVCRCFLELVIDNFQADAQRVLREWGVTRSEHVGHILYGLIDAGLASAGETDTRDDFAGLFDLDREQSTWQLKW